MQYLKAAIASLLRSAIICNNIENMQYFDVLFFLAVLFFSALSSIFQAGKGTGLRPVVHRAHILHELVKRHGTLRLKGLSGRADGGNLREDL